MHVNESPLHNRQKYLDVLLNLFPTGRYGECHPHAVKISAVRSRKSRLYNVDSCLKKDAQYVTRSRKRGPFPQKSDFELDLSADSMKSVVHTRENHLTLAHSIPKLQSFEYHTALTLISRYRSLFQSCRRAQVVSVYYRK